MAFVSASYTPSLPISFDQFRADMMTKWRYQYGDPFAREALWRGQANYYNALAHMGIPSEAMYRQAMADYYLTMAKQAGVDTSLMGDFLSLVLLGNKQGVSPYSTTSTIPSESASENISEIPSTVQALPVPEGYRGYSTNEGYRLVPENDAVELLNRSFNLLKLR